MISPLPVLPPYWQATGCYTEGSKGRSLVASSMTDPLLTVEKCVNFCASQGYLLAGMEYGSVCSQSNRLDVDTNISSRR